MVKPARFVKVAPGPLSVTWAVEPMVLKLSEVMSRVAWTLALPVTIQLN